MLVSNSRRIGIAALVVALGLATGAAAASAQSEDDVKIGAVLFQGDTFFQEIQAGMEAAAEDLGVELLVNNSDNDAAKEAEILSQYQVAGVDAIAMSPLSPDGSFAAVREVVNGGVPVVCYNTCLSEEDSAELAQSFIQTDQTNLGTLTGAQARELIETDLGGSAVIGILNCDAFEACQHRKAGFLAELEGLDFTIAADQEGFIADDATTVAENMLTANPEINLVWAANEGGTVGLVQAIRSTGREGEIIATGTDVSLQLAEMLAADDEVLWAVTGQAPREMGRLAVENAVTVARGGEIDEFLVLTPNLLFARDSAEVADYIDANS
jgi:simple sugar transport system substrate-binding protein